MFKFSTKKIARGGIIAGLYILFTIFTFPIASGTIQLRISEALTLTALFFSEAVLSLTVACALSNLLTGCMVLDVIFGAAVTFAAGVLTYVTGKLIKNFAVKIFVGGLFPVLLNAFLLPIIWYFCYGRSEYLYIIQAALLFAGQGISVYAAGCPLTIFINKLKTKRPELFE